MTKKAVATKAAQALALPEDLIVPEGAGLEEADRDSYAIPFLSILQKTSPQADPDHEAFIDGAKAGQFLDTVAQDLLDGEKEDLNIIPVFYRRAFIEWKTRDDGGGFVAEHSVADALSMPTERGEKGDILSNGNQLVDTRYHYVILVRADGTLQPMVLTMTSTQVKKSKRLNSDLDLQIRGQSLKATFQTLYKIATIGESNEHGTWRGWHISRNGLVNNQAQLDAAVGFYKAIKSGDVKEATDSLGTSGSTDDNGGNPEF
jgi:hypothetical protein